MKPLSQRSISKLLCSQIVSQQATNDDTRQFWGELFIVIVEIFFQATACVVHRDSDLPALMTGETWLVVKYIYCVLKSRNNTQILLDDIDRNSV